ncbi:MAG TPA: 50S ribosomal protein L17 [Planctomycetaceae bacterium]|jgi:large subunit ribosomal protein L17|nr:50S ribosomal protein L17 [Planctomycetaceae bacterium]
MRHRIAGRTLGRNASHRHAMFRNMAASLIKTVRVPEEGTPGAPQVPGRIITTVEKAKELRPYVEKLVTMARKAAVTDAKAATLSSNAARNTPEWKAWRDSPQWREWAQARAPGVAYRRRAFALLRDTLAVDILFDELAKRFETRPGGYTRILRIATRRLGDAGHQALIEFVGVNDRVKKVKKKRQAPSVATAPSVTPAGE